MAETGTGRILGVHISAPVAAGMSQEGALTVKFRLTVQNHRHNLPSLSESNRSDRALCPNIPCPTVRPVPTALERKIYIIPFGIEWYMFDVVTSKRMPDGIVVFWLDEEGKKFEAFGFVNLIDLKINALDLLNNPQNYEIDADEKKLFQKV
ncbi:MAG: hypothetical protein METHP_01987 [Methanoregula sp. SKADARSKE-2]|nr:MAG: hypothetical protein METHP_01987 [Methanoregula sp. SKADARSKE-2]